MPSFDIKRNRSYNFLIKNVLRGGDDGKPVRDNTPRWMGCKVIKFAEDLILYQQVLHQHRPDVLVETGTKFGGSALFFANMFDLLGKGEVITVDVRDFPKKPIHPRITYLQGSSISEDILETIKNMVGDKSCMVSLDSDHDLTYVTREMEFYHHFVTPNQYMVVEDVHIREKLVGPVTDFFLNKHHEFERQNITDQLLMHVTRYGWLLRKS